MNRVNLTVRRLLYIGILGVLGMNLMAQQDPKFSQNMFLAPYYNPGAVGSSDRICLAAAFRNQWMGLPGSPITTTFSANMPFHLLGMNHGVGINLMNDNIAYTNDLMFNVAYAYRMDLGQGSLGIGTNIGLINHSLTEGQWTGTDIINPDGDDAIPQGGTDFGFDMGLGIYYNAENMYVGLSVSHLNQTSFDYNLDDETARPGMKRNYYLMGGYNFQLANPMFEIMPSVMIHSDFASQHIYLNTNIRYNKRFWGGVSYSVGGAMAALFGIELMNGIKIGYSYDFELSPMIKYNSGSHEITVRYCFDLSVDKSPQKYKSIRFL